MDETVEIEQVEVEEIEEQPEEQVEEQSDPQEGESQPDDEIVVTIGEEAPPHEEARAPDWVRELRKQNREKDRRIRELETRIRSTETKPVALGAKPKLEDFDYDVTRFEQALDGWLDRKRIADAEAERTVQAEKHQAMEWNDKLAAYAQARDSLKARDYEDAEETVQHLLDVTQQGIIVQGAENPALVVYALGKNPKRAKELADIRDPVKFAFAVAKLEKDLKVTNRKAAPPPERPLSGTGRVSGAVDSTLERLRAEAEKTGNYSKVHQYKQQKRAASK